METVKGTLKHGLKIGDEVHKDFEMREALAGDLFDAETEASSETPLAFNAALMARQLVRVGSYEGPFSVAMLAKLRQVDYGALRLAQLETESLGED